MKVPKWMADSAAGVTVALVSMVGNGYCQLKEVRRAECLTALREYTTACSRLAGVMQLVATASKTRLRALAPGSTTYVQNLADRTDELLEAQATEVVAARADLYAKLAVANAVFETDVTFPPPASTGGPPAESTPEAAKQNIEASEHVDRQCEATVGEFQRALRETLTDQRLLRSTCCQPGANQRGVDMTTTRATCWHVVSWRNRMLYRIYP